MEEINFEQQLNKNAEILSASRKLLLTSVYYGFAWPIAAILIIGLTGILEINRESISLGIASLFMLLIYVFEYKGFSKLEKHSNPTISLFSAKSKTATCMQGIGITVICSILACLEFLLNAGNTILLLIIIFTSYIIYLTGVMHQLQAFKLLRKDRNIHYWYNNYIKKAIWSIWIGCLMPVMVVIGGIIFCLISQNNDPYFINSADYNSLIIIVCIGIILLKIAQWCMMPYIWKGLFILPSKFNETAPLETDNTSDINRSLNFGKHKKLLITTCVIILMGGITFKMIFTSSLLAETIIQKHGLAELNSYYNNSYNGNPYYMQLFEKISGNAEVEFINAVSRREIPFKFIKKWCDEAIKGDAYAQFVIGSLFLDHSAFGLIDREGSNYINDWAAKQREAIQVDDITDFASGKRSIDLKSIIEKDAHKWFEASAKQGHPRAQYAVAYDYSAGRGTAQDEKTAFSWLLKAAQNGYVEAQYTVADYYTYAVIVEEDLKEAFKWRKKAAEQGHRGAAYHLGIMYKNGTGTAKDSGEAQKWLQKAADMGDEEAERELNSVEN